MMILKKEKLNELLEHLQGRACVFVPQKIEDQVKFAPYNNKAELAFDAQNSLFPPKDLLFPQAEKMYRYGQSSDGNMFISPILDSKDQIIFGIRPCDMRSIDCLDDVFFTKGYVDEYYEAKREKLCCVCIACNTCAQTCFCDSMGNDPQDAPGADIMLHDKGDFWSIICQTDKGKELFETEWAAFCEESAGEGGSNNGAADGGSAADGGNAAGSGADSANTASSSANVADTSNTQGDAPTCSIKIDASNIETKISALENSDELWDALSIKCLNCGTCTFLCPTCYCFDIEQENRNKKGVRFRCWDSCMFSEYTQMAGGHNPRPTKRDKVKNRFMHKLAWFEQRYGKKLCVGCGRCIEKCPVGLDITVLIDKVNELS